LSDNNENTAELKQPHEEWQKQSVGDVRSEMACEGFDAGDGRREEERGERSKAKRIKQPGLSNSAGRVDRVSVFGDAERSGGGSCRDGGGGKQKSRWRLL